MPLFGKMYFAFANPWLWGHSSLLGFIAFYGLLSLGVSWLMKLRQSNDENAEESDEPAKGVPGYDDRFGAQAVVQMVISLSALYGALVVGLFAVIIPNPLVAIPLGLASIVCLACSCGSIVRVWTGQLKGAWRLMMGALATCLPASAVLIAILMSFAGWH